VRCEGRPCAWRISLAGSVVVALCACGGGGAGSSFTPIDITAAAPAAALALESTNMGASTTAAEAPSEDQDSATTADKFANSDAASLPDEKKSAGRPKVIASGQTAAEVLLAAARDAKKPEK
jgi:hypothetical protein